MKLKRYINLALIVLLVLSYGCSNSSENEYSYPTVISGIVRNTGGQLLSYTKISLTTAPDYQSVWTDENGTFRLENFPSGKHKLKAEHVGYNDYTADIPSAINGTSVLNPVLSVKTYNIPIVKPVSKGTVRINGKALETDFDGDGIYTPFKVKGVAFSPTPINNKPYLNGIDDRSIQLLKEMNANTIRTYSGTGKYFLQNAAPNGIRVIVSFWVDTNYDLSSADIRQKVKDEFARMVLDFKDYSAVLMWNLGNEQNYQNGNNSNWYSLAQELAVEAYKVEGEKFHPVCINNGNIYNIGDASLNADDNSLTYVDLWATNIYEYNIATKLNEYKNKSGKPIVVTEYGIDALDNRTKLEYENMQAAFDSVNWAQIKASDDVCVGATVFEFTDEWWKGGTPAIHDYGGYPTSAHPDGYSNEEWWGIIATSPDTNGDGLDEWRPRKVYYMFQRNWK
ncbi:MAG: hypothetical protein C4539_16815 [Ignavibacteriales bacterium]|nr:MAG: hypothetical protein C4539_16815 [Ignavibacteriales bacterium]